MARNEMSARLLLGRLGAHSGDAMTPPSDNNATGSVPVRHRRPKAGERNRGAVDALQTKIAVNLQNLDAEHHLQQIRDNIAELPDATGCDTAFLALFRSDISAIRTIISSGSVFSACNPDALEKESLKDWPWLSRHLGHLRLIEIDDTANGPKLAAAEMSRFAELKLGSILIIGLRSETKLQDFLRLPTSARWRPGMPICNY